MCGVVQVFLETNKHWNPMRPRWPIYFLKSKSCIRVFWEEVSKERLVNGMALIQFQMDWINWKSGVCAMLQVGTTSLDSAKELKMHGSSAWAFPPLQWLMHTFNDCDHRVWHLLVARVQLVSTCKGLVLCFIIPATMLLHLAVGGWQLVLSLKEQLWLQQIEMGKFEHLNGFWNWTCHLHSIGHLNPMRFWCLFKSEKTPVSGPTS